MGVMVRIANSETEVMMRSELALVGPREETPPLDESDATPVETVIEPPSGWQLLNMHRLRQLCKRIFGKIQLILRPLPIQAYTLPDFSFSGFPPDKYIVDIGCGTGHHLRQLVARECRAIGVEPRYDTVIDLRTEGFEVVQGKAEQLPFVSKSVDGVVCSVVVPYTDERAAISEWSRVLVAGGEVRASYHGIGYALRHLFFGTTLKLRLYGLRILLNTWNYWLTGRCLSGWLGDTLCQSPRRLTRYYRQFGFRVLASPPSKRLWGFPVFIYHCLQKVQEDRDCSHDRGLDPHERPAVGSR